MCFVSKSCMQGVFFLQAGAFAHRCVAHESFYTQTIYTRKLLHTENLHTDAFVQQTALHT